MKSRDDSGPVRLPDIDVDSDLQVEDADAVLERDRALHRMYGIGCFAGEMLSEVRLKRLRARGTRDFAPGSMPSVHDDAARERDLVPALGDLERDEVR